LYNSPLTTKIALDIPNVIQKSGICQGGALNLSQAKPTPKQLNLNKLSDAGGLKFTGCSTQAETDF
jgi:hypothetical protein